MECLSKKKQNCTRKTLWRKEATQGKWLSNLLHAIALSIPLDYRIPFSVQLCALKNQEIAMVAENAKTKTEQTLCIIKPDAVGMNKIGAIITLLENGGLRVVAARMLQLTKAKAEEFYAVHKERHFFNDLVRFMTSGPILVMALEGENAILKNREIMGATDSKKAAVGTIRNLYGNFTLMEENAVHGSDAPETAVQEIEFFFGKNGTVARTR
jgi:nucleoside-diphosphate kinase